MNTFYYITVQTNDWYQIELLKLDKDTWYYLRMCKQKVLINK